MKFSSCTVFFLQQLGAAQLRVGGCAHQWNEQVEEPQSHCSTTHNNGASDRFSVQASRGFVRDG